MEYLVGDGVVNGGRLGILTGGAIPGTICGEAEAALVAAGGVLPSLLIDSDTSPSSLLMLVRAAIVTSSSSDRASGNSARIFIY